MNAVNNKALVLDLVEWVARKPRAYSEVIGAWRTSCPRLTVWEDAVDLGLVARTFRTPEGAMVETTAAGRAFLASERRG
jgi:hypothetical protein